MANPKLQTIIENAISKADSSYFFENYTKQAQAVLRAIEQGGFTILPKELPDSVWEQTAKEMRTGRVKPEEHVKDVYLTALRLAAASKG